MRPESTLEPDIADDEARRRTRRRVLLLLGGMLLVVLLGAVPIFVLLGGPQSQFGRRIGFGLGGPTVSTRMTIGPIEVQRSDALAEAGVTVQHVGTSSASRGSILGHSESRGFTIRITPRKEPIDVEDLAFTVIDDRDKVIAEGIVKLPARVAVGTSADGKVDVELHDGDGTPAKVIVRRAGEP